MSYIRIGEDGSDFYVYAQEDETGKRSIVIMTDDSEFGDAETICDTPAEAHDLLRDLKAQGYTVPDRVLQRLWDESQPTPLLDLMNEKDQGNGQ